ncbi:cytochrome c oxidase subunit II [Halovenus carboxidivorans]|nr:cytochrome c oxidase subunit II [Halovenus carboxidivorans]
MPVAQAGQSQADVFGQLYLVFLVLGTIVGTVVISYTVYNAYKYRTTVGDADGRYDVDEEELAETDDYDVARPRQGEIPTGQGKGGGKKLFMSFGISAFLVLGLIIYSYTMLLYVEDTGQGQGNAIEVDVEGYQFGWDYTYFEDEVSNDSQVLASSDYNATKLHPEADSDALVVPKGTTVRLDVTSRDVWHNYGIPEFRAKTDAIPGETTHTWFKAEKTGLYQANCYELCGQGHSNMNGDVLVVEKQRFIDWYTSQENTDASQIEFMEVSS